jgi:predicted transposase YdaD
VVKLAKPWDDSIKMLIRANPQSLVSLLLPGAKFQGEQDKELKARTVKADLLYNVIYKRRKIILHVEFQRQGDKRMARRVWEYNVLTNYLTGHPVYSVVIYLAKRGTIVESRYEEEIAGQIRLLTFASIKLWEVPAEVLKQPGLEGLLPLLPLTQGGKNREVVEETIARLQATGHQDLLPLSYAFAALVFTKAADKLWLKERFEKMHDILEESWAYQEMVQKGLLQGIKQGIEQGIEQGIGKGVLAMQQTAINVVIRSFADLEELARTKITAINNLERLQQLILDLAISHTREQMKQVLLSLDA